MENRLEIVIQLSLIVILSVWLFTNGMLYQTEYPTKLVELYSEPLWKVILVCIVLSTFVWSPRIGILLSLAVILYISDLNSLTK
jgi:hypothetical protein